MVAAEGTRSTRGAKSSTTRGATVKRQRANNRRDDIIRAAAETFYRKGYNATTTQDIADAVGMLKGSLYYYISAKEDLLFEIIDDVHTAMSKSLDIVGSAEGDPLARLYLFVQLNVLANAENLLNSAVFFRDFSALTGRRRTRILALRDSGDKMTRDLIQEGKGTGVVRADVDPKIAATAINTMCNALYHWYRPDGELTPQALAVAYADLAVGGVASSPKHLEAARRGAEQAIQPTKS